MLFRLRFALFLPLAALLACGAGTSSSLSSNSTLSGYNLTGNWQITGTPVSGTSPSPIADFFGSLSSSNRTVSGTIHAFDPALSNSCVPLAQDLAVSGTVDAAGNLALAIALNSGIATITAALPSDAHTFTHGTYEVVGGPCAMPSTPMTIAEIEPVTGTFTGTFTGPNTLPPASSTVSVTANLTQAATPNGNGEYPLTGSVAITGSCTASISITNGLIYGSGLVSFSATGPSASQGAFVAASNPTGATLVGSLYFLAACPATYTGTLTRQ